MKNTLLSVVLSSLIFLPQFSIASESFDTVTEGYPYGCSSSTYLQEKNGYKFRCYLHCYCLGIEDEYLPDEMSEDDCLELATKIDNAIGANVGSNKCHIVKNKCTDFITDTEHKGPYYSRYKTHRNYSG